jgi:signal transduction histidine kinase
VAVSIPPYSWETPTFRVLVGVSLGAMLGVGWLVAALLRRRRIVRVLQQRHALELERSRIARDLHDSLGASLTEISMLTRATRVAGSRSGLTAASLQSIGDKAAEAVESLDGIVWAVDPQMDTLRAFVNYVLGFSREYLEAAGLRLRSEIPTDLPDFKMSATMRHHLLCAIKEALNNAVRHAQASAVTLSLSLSKHELTFTVADDGKGTLAARSEAGRGLENMRERMTQVGGVCSLDSLPEGGMRVVFRVPSSGENQMP